MPRDPREKPIPVMGPGSRIIALAPQIKRFIEHKIYPVKGSYTKKEPGIDLSFNTILLKKLPKEIYKNEEIGWLAKRLDAPNNKLKSLPGAVAVMTGLRRLDFHHNKLKRLPNALGKLEDLEYLDCSDNVMKRLPNSLHKTALVDLIAHTNKVKSPPGKLGVVPKLVNVDLSHNDLKKFAKNMYKLHMNVDFSYNKIKKMPTAKMKKGKVQGIHKLDVSHNDLTVPPAGVEFLQCMTHLNLSHNGFKEIIPNFGGTKYLRNFDISHNALILISEKFCDIGYALDSLNISDNKLKSLPDEFEMFMRITVLNVSHNLLKELPKTFQNMKWLKNINFSHNKLTDVTAITGLLNCEVVNFSHNSIAKIPKHIERLESLIVLDMSLQRNPQDPEEHWTSEAA